MTKNPRASAPAAGLRGTSGKPKRSESLLDARIGGRLVAHHSGDGHALLLDPSDLPLDGRIVPLPLLKADEARRKAAVKHGSPPVQTLYTEHQANRLERRDHIHFRAGETPDG